jgi:uncharacterized membrane protein YbhN (UPF0104 family)
VSEFFHAAGEFFRHLAAVGWGALALALVCHYVRLLCRIPAWRNILKAAYPDRAVPWRGVYGSYVAGIGVNAVLPARGGDVLKLYLVRRRIENSSYPALASTLLVETLFDSFAGAAVLIWALTQNVLPSFGVQRVDLPQVDWSWPLRHPRASVAIGVVWLTVLALFLVIGIRRAREFWAHVKQGFAVLRPPARYVLQVATWQAASWGFRAASVFFFLRAFHVPATARNVALVMAIQSVSTLLPFTPGGAGTQQGFLVYVFKRVEPQVARTAVLSFSVGMYVATTALNVLIGFAAILVMLRTLRFKRIIVEEEKKVSAESGVG